MNLTNLGGFPFTQGTLDFMQQSYSGALSAMAMLAGEKTIVAGVAVVGNVVTGGWIVYNGELIPFAPGLVSADVIIETTTVSKEFQDKTTKPVYTTKVAKCGTPGNFPFADLKRLSSLKIDRWQAGDLKHVSCTPQYILDNFDGAGIGKNDRQGWRIFSDAAGKVLVGYDPADILFDVGNSGGAKDHTLTKAELPNITLNSGMSKNAAGLVNDQQLTDPGPGNNDPIKTEPLGQGQPFSILPPYYVTLIIIKL